jgi:hypothetical protein
MSSVHQVKAVIFIFLVVHTGALLIFQLLPFIDLPNHLAEATIYKYAGKPGNVLAQYYQPTPWFFPNSFHTVFCSLFPDVEIGNKIFHILCLIGLQAAVFLAIKELGGNLWYGLLGTLFTYNYNLSYGFVGFAISIPIIIVLFYTVLLDFRLDTLVLKIIISLLLLLLFLMHAQNALFGLLLYGLLTIYNYRKSFRKMFLRILTVPLPFLVLMFTWWFTRSTSQEESTAAYLFDYYSSDYFSGFLIRFRIVVQDNFQLQQGAAGIIIAALLFACIFIPLIWFRVWKNKDYSFYSSNKHVYVLIFFITALGCYLLLPDKLPGQTPLFQRFSTIVILSFIIWASLFLRGIQSVRLTSFIVVAMVIYSFLWIEYLHTFNRINQSFSKNFFQQVDNRARLAGLIYDNKYRGRKVYIHFPNYFIVWNQGIAASKIIDYRFGVVRRVASELQLPFYNELIGDGYRKLDQYSSLEYLLVRGTAPVTPDVNLAGFSRVKQSGSWQLYQRRAKP